MKKTILILIAAILTESTAIAKEKEGTKMTTAPTDNSIYDISKIAPEFNKITQEFLNGDIWKRPPLSARDKSLVTITILVSLSRYEQLDVHLNKALDNGLSEQEIVAAMTHTAFYAGWPAAYTGITHLKKILDERKTAQKK